MKNSIKLLKVGIVICFILFLAGCGYTKEEKELMKQYSKQAKINAKNYIFDKYGFEADIIDTYLEKCGTGPIPDFSPPPTSWVYVEMKYNNKKFHVYITGEKESTDGYDNYQFDIVKKAFMEYVKNKLKVEPVMCNFYYGENYPFYEKYNGLIHQYYDGTNLKEALSSKGFRAVFEYVNDVDFKSIHNSNYFDGYLEDGLMLFVKYPTENAYDKVSTHLYNILGTPQTNDLYENAIYIDNALLVDNIGDEYYEFNLNEYDGFYYLDSDNNEKVKFSKTLPEDPSNWKGKGTIDAKIISDAYSIETSAKSVRIYFPISKINKPNKFKDIKIATSYMYKGEKDYSADTLVYKVGDYYFFSLYLKDYSDVNFVILEDTK